MPKNEQHSIHHDLPLADLLSLFMISEAHGDVCATHIAYPRAGHLILYMAKNQVKGADQEHLTKLMDLCQGGFLGRWPDYPAFKEAAIVLLIQFCGKKMRKRLEELSWAVLLALVTEFTIEGHELRGFGVWDELVSQGGAGQAEVQQAIQGITGKPLKEGSGDIAVLSWATKSRKKLSAVILEQLRFLGMSLEGGAPGILSSVSLFSRVSGIADKLHRSALFEALLHESNLCASVINKLKVDLGKVGAYSRGLELLYRTLSAPEKSGGAPFEIRYHLLDPPPQITVDLDQYGDWYRFLKEFSESPGGGSLPRKQELEAALKGDGKYSYPKLQGLS